MLSLKNTTSLVQNTTARLSLTPELRQLMALLTLPALELAQYLRSCAETNVILEVIEPETEAVWEAEAGTAPRSGDETAPPAELSGETDFEPVLAESRDGTVFDPEEFAPPRSRTGDGFQADRTAASRETLLDYLLWQLDLSQMTHREQSIAWVLVEGLNEDGYLTLSDAELLASLDPTLAVTFEELEAVRYRIQQLDPVGVCCRSLPECLSAQLVALPPDTPGCDLAKRWIREAPASLAHGTSEAQAARLGTDLTHLQCAWALIRSLHPKPGSSYPHASETPAYVIPDLRVTQKDGRWIAQLENRYLPRLRLDPLCSAWVGGSRPSLDHPGLRAQLREARGIIKNLTLRNESLLRLAQAVVDYQADYFTGGDACLRPLSLREMAGQIGLHESTVSRTVQGKYITTVRGIIPFRRLFSVSLETRTGTATSAAAVRARLRAWIDAEDPLHPLTDDTLTQRLSQEGVMIARRTVAKYREALGVPAFRDRTKSRPGTEPRPSEETSPCS
ncbi:RNA polymerase, sigma 54 subunit, RpoN [mine drainage metagenome]|uniref:RNA polymerase, sigma 54 subunit, RpoN n=3 Tax=mine drainage metagenome TaxID=410659 RepID=T1C712_9ZZZZ